MEPQKPVPADVLDELKMIAATHAVCMLQFRAVNGGLATVQTKLADVFEDSDGQFLLGENGLVLQLHQLVSINGNPLEFYG